ncbi:MAG: phosphoenolpyruvate--protein phosphotransferase [Planctomycetota bacterium]
MLIKRGIAVSPGVAIGPSVVLGAEVFKIPDQFVPVDAIETELARLRRAIDAVGVDLEENEHVAADRFGTQYGAIFSAHRQLLADPNLVGEIETLIRTKSYAPEHAVRKVIRRYAELLQGIGKPLLAERSNDLLDLEKHLLSRLLGEPRGEVASLVAPAIVVAHNLTPSETASLDRRHVHAFVTETGGRTSHTSILAGALEIPALVGVGRFLDGLGGGETVIVDGDQGVIIIAPDDGTLARYRERLAEQHTLAVRREAFADVVPQTADGERIRVLGNIEFPDEVDHCVERGADGVGLYRTEFLYLGREVEPTEDDHVAAYRRVIAACGSKPVTIRTLDLGADKMPHTLLGAEQADETHSALGLRSIRLSLVDQSLFKTQLRAILRASVEGDVRIMFPLISTLAEIRQAKFVLKEVQEDLEEDGVAFRRDIPVGMMVEVPSAALLAEEFAQVVDFFSIGTNDLIQYTLAVDRAETLVAPLYNSGDPSVLRLIRRVIRAGRKAGIPVTVCGQMSSDPKYLPVLIGLGLKQVSVTPQAIPQVKDTIGRLDRPTAAAIARHVMQLEVASDIDSYLMGRLAVLRGEAE